MGILDAILDAIGDSIKKWAKKTGKPAFGIGCLIAAVLFFVFAVKSGIGYVDYLSKPGKFSVTESISYEDLSERRGGYVDEDRKNMNTLFRAHILWTEKHTHTRQKKKESPWLIHMIIGGMKTVLFTKPAAEEGLGL